MSVALKQMTGGEFLIRAEARQGRWELISGEPVKLASETLLHVGTKGEACIALRDAMRSAGSPGQVFLGGMAVSVDAETVYDPDVSVVTGPRLSGDALSIDNPVIVVEVLSPSTAAIDHGPKLSGDFSLPSVEHYLILDPDRRVLIHHKRGQGDAIETRVRTDGIVKLDPPGFEIAVAAMFPEAVPTRSG